ncbi:MAG: hypothetical protein KBD07_06165 [Candidatus Omnitrophica bacterium]|nr:hypothetical protein [Candidatus Omnitrophota bacterium]
MMIEKTLKTFGLAIVANGLLQMMTSTTALAANPELAGQTVAVDQSKDGKPDHWVTYNESGVRVLIASDTNQDGRPDYWKHPIRGMMILKEKDLNYDGRVDERQVTDFVYDRTLKISRHVYTWREADTDFDGVVDVYKVRGEKNPVPDHRGEKMDATPWSIAKEAAIEKERKASETSKSAEAEQVRQMNERQSLRS